VEIKDMEVDSKIYLEEQDFPVDLEVFLKGDQDHLGNKNGAQIKDKIEEKDKIKKFVVIYSIFRISNLIAIL
jgi:hypothetical protein